MPRAAVLEPGTILDARYRVDAPVGEGGFATVHSAFHLTLGVRVAIKVLHLDSDDAERDAERFGDFLEEAKLVTKLRHDHIVRTLDQGIVRSEDGRSVPYLVMEWCGDESLADRMRVTPRLPLSDAYAIVLSVTEAMAHAHAAGVVHRDLKPGNVMLAKGPDGELVPRVIDFGVAKVFEGGDPISARTATQTAGKYTPAYAAPEQVAGTRTGPYTDVHAIGLLFCELLTGRAPFSDSALGNVDPERPSPKRAGVEVGAFEPVIARAVALRPADRYRDAGELLTALQSAARKTELGRHTDPTSARDLAPPSTQTGAPTSRVPEDSSRRGPMIALAGVAAVAAIFYATRTRTAEVTVATPQPVTPVTSSAPAVDSMPVIVPPVTPPPPSATPSATAKKTVAAPTKSAEKPKQDAPAASNSKGVGGIIETPPF